MAENLTLFHDWNKPVLERISYLTNVIETHDGTEQRIRLRRNPRRSYQYYIWTATNDIPSEQSRLQAIYNQQLRYSLGNDWFIPIWTDYQILPADYSSGVSTITIPTTYLDYRIGGKVIIIRNFQTYEIKTIDTFNSSSITFTTATAFAWKKGDIVAPIREAWPAQESFSGIKVSYHMQMADQFWDIKVEDSAPSGRISNITPTVKHNGYEVLLKKSHYPDDLNFETFNQLRRLDNQTGVFKNDPRHFIYSSDGVSRYLRGRNRFEYKFLSTSRQDYAEYLGFLERCKGRLLAFYYPNWNNELNITSSGSSGTTSITVLFCGLSNYPANLNPAILFKTVSGTYITKNVTGTPVNNGDGTETFTISTGLGISWTSATFEFVCFMNLVRLDQDMIEIQHQTTTVGAESNLTFVTSLENDSGPY